MRVPELDIVLDHVRNNWASPRKITVRERLPLERADDLIFRAHVKRGAWHSIAKVTSEYLLVCWEESWCLVPSILAVTDVDRPVQQITEDRLEEMASYFLGISRYQYSELVYQIEGICLPRLPVGV
jgi:hypothetical protein